MSNIQFNQLHARGVGPQQRILWASLFVQGLNGRRGLPYVLVGKPGSAKTSNCKQIAAMAGLAFEGVLGSLRSPIDFLGVPIPRKRALTAHDQHLSPDGDAEFTYMHYAPAGFSVRAAVSQRCLLMLDEVNTCPPSVQAALLRVLFEGVVGELELPPGVRIILAMNETKDAAGGWDIAPPLANRMGWLDWEEPMPQNFAKFLLTGGQMDSTTDVTDPAVEEAEVDARWGKAWAVATAEITGFLTKRGPEMLLKMPTKNAGSAANRAWPSPRTWEMAVRALAGSYVYDLTEIEREQAVSAFVGSGAFGEFFTWKKSADLPDPEHLLDGQASFQHSAARLDKTAAVLTACTAIVTAKDPEMQKKRDQRAKKMWNLIKNMPDDATDVCLPSVVALCGEKLMLGNNEAYQVLAKMEPVMSAAGVSRVQ